MVSQQTRDAYTALFKCWVGAEGGGPTITKQRPSVTCLLRLCLKQRKSQKVYGRAGNKCVKDTPAENLLNILLSSQTLSPNPGIVIVLTARLGVSRSQVCDLDKPSLAAGEMGNVIG